MHLPAGAAEDGARRSRQRIQRITRRDSGERRRAAGAAGGVSTSSAAGAAAARSGAPLALVIEVATQRRLQRVTQQGLQRQRAAQVVCCLQRNVAQDEPLRVCRIGGEVGRQLWGRGTTQVALRSQPYGLMLRA